MKEKDCNCKKTNKKLIESIETINKTKSKGYINKNKILNKIYVKLTKFLTYIMFFSLLFILFLPILLILFIINIILKKPVKIRIPLNLMKKHARK